MTTARPSGWISGCFDPLLLSRVEDAGLNASAPPQQRWLDGWLLRFSPGKARRARCINAVAQGRLLWTEKLGLARSFYRQQDLPALMRITPFTLPPVLDAELADAGSAVVDPTVVMVRVGRESAVADRPADPPDGLIWIEPDPAAFATAIGALRGSSAEQIAAHTERLVHAPVAARRWALVQPVDGKVLACGQSVKEADIVGLYDIHTHVDARKKGLATMLCERLLSAEATENGHIAYLQVEDHNLDAQRLYRRLGFAEAYGYHYRGLD